MCITHLLTEVLVYSYLRHKFYISFITITKGNKTKQRKHETCGADTLFSNVFFLLKQYENFSLDIDKERITYNVH